MTLASWFSSMRHSRRRLSPDRGSPQPLARIPSEGVVRSPGRPRPVVDGEFQHRQRDRQRERRHVQHPGHALGHGTPTVSTFASGFNDPAGLAFDAAGNLYVANSGDDTVSEVTPAGGSAPSPPGSTSPPAWPSTPPATSTSPTPATTR